MAERVLMALLLGGIATGCIVILYPFFTALLWAAILAFTTWPVFVRLRASMGRVPGALLMAALTVVVVVIPIGVVATAGADDVPRITIALRDWAATGLPAPPRWLIRLPVVGAPVADAWHRGAADLNAVGVAVKPYLGTIASNGLTLLVRIASGVAQFGLALFIAFFFWIGGDALGGTVTRSVRRIAGPYADRLIGVTGSTVRGTVYGILGTALVQGILTSFGLYIAQVPSPVLLGAIAAFLAVLPVGAPLVWIPAALALAFSGHLGHGIFLGVYGVVAISGADHIIRPAFIARGAQLPYLLTVLGVLGGVLEFGALGIFLGPVLLGVGFTLVAEFAGPGDGPGRGSGNGTTPFRDPADAQETP